VQVKIAKLEENAKRRQDISEIEEKVAQLSLELKSKLD